MSIADDFNEVLREAGEPLTTLEELERCGFVEIVDVSWDDVVERFDVKAVH